MVGVMIYFSDTPKFFYSDTGIVWLLSITREKRESPTCGVFRDFWENNLADVIRIWLSTFGVYVTHLSG